MTDLSLGDLQRQFLAHLRGHPAASLAAAITHARMSPEVGLNIYAHAYGARLRAALEHDHPVLGSYLGDQRWDELCAGYIAAFPSRHRSLRDLGADLPDFLAQTPAFRAIPEVAELARLERSLLDSFDSADAERAEWTQLLARPESAWPTLRLRFHPSLKVHRVLRNSVEIWRALKDGATPPPAAAASSTEWLLWRDTDRVCRFRSLDGEESTALGHCLDGGDFAGLCESLLAWHGADAVPPAALAYLRAWCDEGLVSRWD